ncbi:MAG TPA: glycosyltransferase family 4 protein [Candidatus Saccharicenans sp.]|nr:glycosyltransferase family 4 protein [Candidatus Saccharicenans sp.]HQO75301.1 glycosyltransferase family 4 protein [Candidatus Saccharicenans sp.]HUM78682.1 glycosyltransferase family 4 protein [Candidatus Saccharicenans sp.]
MAILLAAADPQEELQLKHLFFVAQELKKRSYPFYFLTNPGNKLSSQAKLAGYPVLNFKTGSSGGWLANWQLARKMKKQGTSLIHFFDDEALVAGLKASQKAEVAIKLASVKTDWLKRIEPSKFRELDSLICANDENKRQWLKNDDLRVKSVEVIPFGLDFSKYQNKQKKSFLREELRLKEGDFLAGLLTPLEDLKIFRDQLEALKILNEQAPRLKVIVLGQGSLHLEQLRHEQPLAIENLCFYLGFEEKRADVLASLDMFIFGAFSLPEEYLLEAMALRLPVVGVMTAGMTELIINRETGFLVPPNDPQTLAQAILKIYLDRSLAQQLAQQAYNLVFNKHSCEAMAEKVVNYYELLALQKGVRLGR